MTLTGLVKANGANPFVAATAGTDYLIPGGNLANCTNLSLTSGVTGTLPVANGGTGVVTLTGLVKANGTNAFVAATAGTDFLAPPLGTSLLKANSGGALSNAVAGTDYMSAQSVTGIVKSSGTTRSAAVAGTDYVVPTGSITGTAGGLSSTLPVANGGTGVTTSTGSGNIVLSTSPTLTTPILTSYSSIQALFETATVTGSAPTLTTNFDVISQAVQYYTSDTTTNFTFNLRGNGSTTLNTVMSIGQSATIALLVTNSTTAYYPNVIQVDGTSQSVKWQNGTAISSGNASAIDVYTFTVMKTAANVYTVLGSQTKFA